MSPEAKTSGTIIVESIEHDEDKQIDSNLYTIDPDHSKTLQDYIEEKVGGGLVSVCL